MKHVRSNLPHKPMTASALQAANLRQTQHGAGTHAKTKEFNDARYKAGASYQQDLTAMAKEPKESEAVKLALYNLSLRSSVTKANSGKIQRLGSFEDRVNKIKNSSVSNFFSNMEQQSQAQMVRNQY